MRQFITKNKKILIFIIMFIIVTLIATLTYFWIIKEKVIENKINNVNSINILSPLEEDNEIEASQIVKGNIVKITNEVNDFNTTQIGTGFFDKSGYVVTNSHIVDRQGTIKINYAGNEYKAYIVSNDITSDVALLYVDGMETKDIQALTFGSTLNLQEPSTVICLGFALNLEGDATITKGAFSGRRSAAGIEYLQSDAAVNPGMSGGPLINSRAELIGMNSLSSENATINMSISSESLENIIVKLINNKEVNYVTGERHENALSSVLKETSYDISDLYGEKDVFTKVEEQKKEENNVNNENNHQEDKNNTSKVENTTTQKKPSTNSTKPSESNKLPETTPPKQEESLPTTDNTEKKEDVEEKM